MNKRNGYSRLEKIVMAGLNRMDAAIEKTVRENEIKFINEVLVPSFEYYYRLKSRFIQRNDGLGISISPDATRSSIAFNTEKGIVSEFKNGDFYTYGKIISGYPAIWPNAKTGRNCMRDD